jgi:hypothetical protein
MRERGLNCCVHETALWVILSEILPMKSTIQFYCGKKAGVQSDRKVTQPIADSRLFVKKTNCTKTSKQYLYVGNAHSVLRCINSLFYSCSLQSVEEIFVMETVQ